MLKPPAYELAAARIRVMQTLLKLHGFIRIEDSGEVIGTAPPSGKPWEPWVEVSLGSIADSRDIVSLDNYLQSHPTPHTW